MNDIFSWKIESKFPEALSAQLDILENYSFLGECSKISFFSKVISPLIQLIDKTPLTKYFVRWLGYKEIYKNHNIDAELIAKYLLETAKVDKLDTDVWKKHVLELKDKMLTVTKAFIDNNFKDHIPVHLQEMDAPRLDCKLWKSYHGVLSCLAVISELQESKSFNPNIKKIIAELKVWLLHYLVVLAKQPLIDLSQDQYNYSFSEYDKDNEPHYHREDGGAIVTLFISQLKKKNLWLKDFPLDLIKKGLFRHLVIKCCQLFKNTNSKTYYLKVKSLNIMTKIYKKINVFEKQTCLFFLDFSYFFEQMSNEEQEGPKFLEKIKNKIKSLNLSPNIKIIWGAVLTFASQDCFFFNLEADPISIQFKNLFKTLQGSHGGYPEIMSLKHSLIELDYDINTFLELYPIGKRKCFEIYLKMNILHNVEMTKENVRKEQQALIETLGKIDQEKDDLSNHFLSLFSELFKNLPTEFVVEDSIIYKVVAYRYRKIKKLLLDLNKISYQETLGKFYLIIEHLQNLLIYVKIDSMEPLPRLINSLEPFVKDNIYKETLTFTSGIACYGNIAEAVMSELPKESELFFEKMSYYELTESDGSVRRCLEGTFKCKTESLLNYTEIEGLENQSVIFTDLYPNRVVYPSVQKIDIEAVIHFILKKRQNSTKGNLAPLIVIIDCSTTFFMHQEIQILLNKLYPHIESGQLAIILTNSFAKYGMDKFSGGVVQVYCSKSDKRIENMLDQLRKNSIDDPFSFEANRFYYLLFKYCSKYISLYVDKIRNNTCKVYTNLGDLVLQKTGDQNFKFPIHVGFRDEMIPMMGFHFDFIYEKLFSTDEKSTRAENEKKLKIIVIIMQYLLFVKFIEKNLPVTLKQSFGFPAANLIECSTALRFTIGLETKLLSSYSDIIKEENKNLNLLLESEQKQKEIARNIEKLALKDMTEFKKKIYLHHICIYKHAIKGFEELLNYFISLYEENKSSS